MKPYILIIISGLFFLGCERPTEISQVDDNIPPGVPEGLRVYYAADAQIIIEWILNPRHNIKGYNVYRRTENSELKMIGFSTNDYYDDVFLEYDTLYFYAISAEDISGVESALTNEVSAKPMNKYRPLIPSSVSINARNWAGRKSIFLDWIENDEYDIKEYKVFRDDNSDFAAGSDNLVGISEETEFEDTTVSELYKKYYYKIVTVDKGQLESNPSSEKDDMILENPTLINPAGDTSISNLNNFVFLSVGVPAVYKIIVQTNFYFGEIWQTDINSTVIYDSVQIQIPSGVFTYNTTYYWRVATFTVSEMPNSFSSLNRFIIIP